MKRKIIEIIFKSRYIFLAFSFVLIFTACNQSKHIAASEKTIGSDDPLEGVWELISYCRLANEDTTFKSQNNTEHKIYLDGYVMWNHDPDPDSSEWHGYGTYTFSDSILTETLTSMSIPMRRFYTPTPMKIVFGKDSFEQVQKSEINGVTYQQIWRYKKLN